MDSNTINIEKIMEEIRLEIRSKVFDEIEDFEDCAYFGINGIGAFEPFDRNEFIYELSTSSQKYVLPTSFPVEGNFKFIKRTVRKFTFFITRQLAEFLTEYNCHIIRTLNQVRNYIFEHDRTDAEQKKCISEMADLISVLHSHSGKIRKISNENIMLRQKIALLENTSEECRNKTENLKEQMEILKERLEITERKYQMLNEKNS